MFVKKKQSGITLLVLMIILALSLSAYYFSTISVVKIKADSVQQTRLALKKAKQSLIDYASTESYIDDRQIGEFGFLPCPDSHNALQEGVQDGNCAARNKNKLGWFPNITIEQPYIKDGSGSCLMYAISGAYKQSPITGMLNEDTNGQFQVVNGDGTVITGQQPQDRIVAIIFSPGDVLPGQTRSLMANTNCGRDYTNVSSYLEGNALIDNSTLIDLADSVDQFIHATATSSTETPPYNDQFITITRDELWTKISDSSSFLKKMNKLTEVLAQCLSNYASVNSFNRLPYPAPMLLSDYREDANYDDVEDDSDGYAGRFPFLIESSNNKISVGSIDDLFTQGACSVIGGISEDLTDENNEYRILWKNWKDHFFYAVSQDYAPDSSIASCSGNCITVNGVSRSAVVFFSGTRIDGQIRTGPVGSDVNTKHLIANYIENGNDALFPDMTGSAAYNNVAPELSNDIMYCLSDSSPITVSNCTL